MRKDFKEAWLKALTDGSYRRQCAELVYKGDPDEAPEGRPVDLDHYRCCLGVAHAIGQQMGLIPADRDLRDAEYENDEILFDDEAEAIGLTLANQQDLAGANDDHSVPDGKFYPDQVINYIRNLPED